MPVAEAACYTAAKDALTIMYGGLIAVETPMQFYITATLMKNAKTGYARKSAAMAIVTAEKTARTAIKTANAAAEKGAGLANAKHTAAMEYVMVAKTAAAAGATANAMIMKDALSEGARHSVAMENVTAMKTA